jgi:IclR family acetate operon transcriptional repressor
MTNKTSSIQVIDRMSKLIDAIAQYDVPVSLKILSADTGLHPSTAFRILASMEMHEFVERDESGRYRLGIRFLRLGGRIRSRLDLRQEARGIMAALRDQVGETVNLAVREGDEMVYVERAKSNRMMRVEQVVGSRAPLHVTAVGKLMLGEEGEASCRSYAERTRLPAYTPNTLTDVERLVGGAQRDTAQGYSLDNEEAELGVGCIGVLVRDSRGQAVAGLSVSSPIERRRDEWIPLVMDAARRLSERLGYQAPVELAANDG